MKLLIYMSRAASIVGLQTTAFAILSGKEYLDCLVAACMIFLSLLILKNLEKEP